MARPWSFIGAVPLADGLYAHPLVLLTTAATESLGPVAEEVMR
jgi:hypothetical protein